MKIDQDIYFVSAGLGWPRTDDMKQFGSRYVQTEASEQTALDICVGLAYSGKIPILYTITPFLYRGFETIRTYINHENLHVILIGAGRDEDYSIHDGYSHDAKDIKEILGTQKNIDMWFPDNKRELEDSLNQALVISSPHFISVTR